MGQLDDKVVLVTGAARGTGEVTARRCAEEGARVLLTDVLDDRGAAVAASIGPAARYRHLDVADPNDWAAAVEQAETDFGGMDTLVNNAAILDVKSIRETDVDVLTRLIAVNLIGPYLGIQAAIDPMKRRGGGSIINVASTNALVGTNGVAAYSTAKWGLRGLSKSAAIELGMHAIRVNTMCPGGGSDEMTEPFVEEALERINQRTEPLPAARPRAFHRESEMIDFANAVVWLASDQSSYVSGIDLAVDGASTAGVVEPLSPFS